VAKKSSPLAEYGRDLWWKRHGPECASAVNSTCQSLERTQLPRRTRWKRNLELYEGRKLSGLNPSSYYDAADIASGDYDVIRVNLARALVNTAVAKIAGKQKPKCQFVVSDGDWATKRKAKKLERFVEAHMQARQGGYHDAWAVGIQAFRDCGVGDLGVLKFEANLREKRIDVRRVFAWELMVNAQEARMGEPQSIFHSFLYDRFKLCDRFPEHEEAILSAQPETDPDDRDNGPLADRMVRVREAWRLPISPEKPGRHALVVGKADLTCSKDNPKGEEWTRKFFPFEFFVWEQWMMGMFGTSIIDNVYHLVDDLNAATQRMQDSMRLGSNMVIDCEENTYEDGDIESNKAVVILKRKMGKPPVGIHKPEALSAADVQWWRLLEEQAYKIPGISQMAASGQKEQGVDAAVAMRTIEDIATERFSVPWQMYERVMSVGAARQIIACTQELAEEFPNFSVKWPGSSFLKEFSWKDAKLEEDQYVSRPAAVSGLVNTPGDIKQLASELFGQGIIGKEAYLRVIQYNDIDSEIGNTTSWSRLIKEYIESWLEATPAKEKSGEFLYQPPIKFAPLADMIVQVGRAWADAMVDGAPDYNLGFFIRFMGQCDAQIQSLAKQQAELQATASGNGPPPVPGPGGPPLPAGPPGPGAAPMPPMGPPPGGMLQ